MSEREIARAAGRIAIAEMLAELGRAEQQWVETGDVVPLFRCLAVMVSFLMGQRFQEFGGSLDDLTGILSPEDLDQAAEVATKLVTQGMAAADKLKH